MTDHTPYILRMLAQPIANPHFRPRSASGLLSSYSEIAAGTLFASWLRPGSAGSDSDIVLCFLMPVGNGYMRKELHHEADLVERMVHASIDAPIGHLIDAEQIIFCAAPSWQQPPDWLASLVSALLVNRGMKPAAIVEDLRTAIR